MDARAGPGAKNFVKQKKKEEAGEEFEKIRRKHFNKKPLRTNSSEEECLVTSHDNLEVSSSRLRENKIGDFFDSYYWKRYTLLNLYNFCAVYVFNQDRNIVFLVFQGDCPWP